VILIAAAIFFFGGQFVGGGSQTKKVDVDIKAPAVPGKSPRRSKAAIILPLFRVGPGRSAQDESTFSPGNQKGSALRISLGDGPILRPAIAQ